MFKSFTQGHAFEIPKFFAGLFIAVQIPIYAAIYSTHLASLHWSWVAGVTGILAVTAAIAYLREHMVFGVFAGTIATAVLCGHFLSGQSVLIGDLTLLAMIAQIAVADVLQPIHALERALPVVAHFRRLFEKFREEIRQYLFEDDDKGQPANRLTRNLIYRLSKGESTDIGLGTTQDYTAVGKLRIHQSGYPIPDKEKLHYGTMVVGADLEYPWYIHGRYGIGDGSFGSFGKVAVQAFTSGAKFGLRNLRHSQLDPEIRGVYSTGEGGLSEDYHLKGVYIENTRMARIAFRMATALSALNSNWRPDPLPRVGHLGGGDIMWEIGTGNFGCCNKDGSFNLLMFLHKAAFSEVVAIKWKHSQGAKPGCGAILPGPKVTPEIAAIRNRPVGEDCISPNRRPEWTDAEALCRHIQEMRILTQKPQGIKFAVGDESFVRDIVHFLSAHKGEKFIDFFHVDGGEGGTGAAPQSIADYVGMSVKHALPLVDNILREYGMRDEIFLISSGKAFTPADVYWHLCMGADYVMSTRGPMLAVGCLQTLKCDRGECPVGITTHHWWLQRAFNPSRKYLRAAMLMEGEHTFVQLYLRLRGKRDTFELTRDDIHFVEKYAEIPASQAYPYPEGCDQPRKSRSPASFGLPAFYDPRVHGRMSDYKKTLANAA
jgi:glutamate synthase domain-containing protein 2